MQEIGKEEQTSEKWLYEYSTANYMDNNNPELRNAKRELLKQGYSNGKRTVEIMCTLLVAFLFPYACLNIASHFSLPLFPALIGGITVGILFADFMSGLVHWGADTWGTLEVPFFGPTFIRSFREHHVVPAALCEHDWFETNGDNFMLTIIPLYYVGFILKLNLMGHNSWEFFVAAFWISTCFGVALTNQFHKWAHTHRPPSFVTFLQKYRIILPKENHTQHHKPAFDGYYCITTGWLNPFLDSIGFWKTLEKIISRATGLIPREDDWKWTGLVAATPVAVKNFMAQKEQKQE